MKSILALLFLGLTSLGCEDEPKDESHDWICLIESSTAWSGYFADHSVDGNGDQMVDLPNDDIVCVSVQKQTTQGFLRIGIAERGRSPGGWVETTAQYGVVTACNQ